MKPAFSVLFLTTLIGVGQGLQLFIFVLSIFDKQEYSHHYFYVIGSLSALVLCLLGLIASVFHLGHPERAWRAILCWKTSWLSRECLCLPLFMLLTLLYGISLYLNLPYSLWLGFAASVVALALFVCTSMIYACLKFIKQWSTPWTLVNFIIYGTTGGILTSWLCALCTLSNQQQKSDLFAILSGISLLLALSCFLLSLVRNQRPCAASTLQSATGISGSKVKLISRGFTASSFNLKEFFHGKSGRLVLAITWASTLLAFICPLLLVICVVLVDSISLRIAILGLALISHYLGILAERWLFFACAEHPQNIYYRY
ncbi:dimethyl sulfoxide reductase anchor subunit family protein [Dongshaea marina]|uniref:dimethyl sulfoxide reductase anchor subunit family protein n=1 Tax=Dongshaea marina TaxID=2047966 RepID=UPI000D3E7851|nr:DmsC/YnfH family molybdoenzyme membrane anchor subunit [Dongshaea marina]